jgi:paraquat-inducible protein B
MKKKIEDVLSQISEDVLTEDSKKMLTEAFNDAVEVAVAEKLDLEVTGSLQKLDEEHSVKLEQLLEAIDTDHTQKLMAVLEKVDADHTEKLEFLIKKNDKMLKEDANEFKETLLAQLSKYLEVYVERAMPVAELKEAVQNKKAQKMVDQVKQLMALDDSFISNTIKEAVEDGRNTINTLKQELNEAIKQNIQISQGLKAKSAELVLEKNTAGLPKEKKTYVMRMLKDKDPEYIVENLDYVIKMFDKEDEEQKELVTEQAKKSSKTITEKVDTPRSDRSTEANIPEPESEGVVDYLSAMKRQDRFVVK